MELQVRAPLNKRGFTLVEVLVSLLILACGLLGSLVGLTSATKHVIVNEMRNEAVKIAQEQCEIVRNTPFGSIASVTPTAPNVFRQIRKQQVPFTVTTNVTNFSGMGGVSGIGGNSSGMLVTITVTWNYKTQQYGPYQLQTVVRQML